MGKFFLIAAFFVTAPVIFIFGLIIATLLYNESLNPEGNTQMAIYAALPTIQNNFSANIIQSDGRAEKIRQFLAYYNSPLEPYAQDIVNAADQYGIDYRLTTAIAMQESNLCKVIPINSYNCWGFGVYGKTVTRFSGYKEAIYAVTKTLATKYAAHGLVTPDQIMTLYTPESDGSWSYSVNHFMQVLE